MTSSRLSWACRILSWCAAFGVLAIAVGIAGQALQTFGLLPALHGPAFHMTFDTPPAPPGAPLVYVLGSVLLNIVPGVFLVWVFVALYRLMRLFTAGDVFTPSALHQINAIARGLLGNALGIIILTPFSGLLLTLGQPHPAISVNFSNHDGVRLFEAAVVYVIALVMAEARRLADENARFV